VSNKLSSLLKMSRDLERGTLLAAARYGLARSIPGARHRRHRPQGAFKTPGSVMSLQEHERGITLTCQRGALRLTVIAPDCMQVRFQPSAKFAVPFSYAVAKVTWPDVRFTVDETDETITLSAPEITCQIERATSRLTVQNAAGQVISSEAEPIAWRDGEFKVCRDLPDDEACLGLAEQPVGLDLRGKRYVLWNTDPLTLERGSIPPYFTIPFYLGVHKDFACGIFWDNPSRGWIDVGAEQPDCLTFSGSVGELRYYLFSGPDPAAVLNRYTELTGRMPMPPIWALGFHISRWSYYPADKVREIAHEFRKRNIPCDAIYLDIHYMDGYRCFTWDRERFPAPAVLIKELLDQGFKTVAIVDPGIKVDSAYPVYQSGLREDVFVRYPGGKPFSGPVWPGKAVFPDFSSPKARAWWAGQFDALIKPGVAGVWNDMNEPTIFTLDADRTLPEHVRHDFEGKEASHLEAHNVYGMLMARASREALEKTRPGKRPFNVTRSAYTGAQRYASAWTGSNRSTWDHLRLSISMVINSGLSGLAFTGPDVGGFSGNAEPELFTRWLQLGSMMPYFRVHTGLGTADQEPWAFGQPHEDIARHYINLRYQLLPYFYSLFAQNAQTGMPILRPLFMVDPADEHLWRVEDAFMVGDALLVAPVLEKGQAEREVYLPRGRWYDYHTCQPVQGGRTICVQAPLNTMPMFARAGRVIPLWPVQQYVGQVPIKELYLRAYAGNGEITLYEDAGEGLDYLNGDYRWLYFTLKVLPTGGVSIDWRRAGKYKAAYDGVRCEVFGIEIEPKAVELDGQAAPIWYFEQGVVEFTAKRPFDNAQIIDPSAGEDDGPQQTLLHSPFKHE
jgi:alpha-glucosidase